MTPQDIEELKALCEKEGFDIKESHEGQTFFIKKKDEWDGVEFVQSNWSKTIYPVNQIRNFKPCNDEYTPSTEAAYIEQLKAKAKELYGEIKDGDGFWIDENLGKVSMYDCEDGFSYWKEEDLLYFGNYAIYSKGKWAKRVEEPIKANITSFTLSNPYSTIVFTTSHRIKDGQVDTKEFINHIEESIEAFLNRKR